MGPGICSTGNPRSGGHGRRYDDRVGEPRIRRQRGEFSLDTRSRHGILGPADYGNRLPLAGGWLEALDEELISKRANVGMGQAATLLP